MMTRNDAVALQLFCVMMTFSDALPVLSNARSKVAVISVHNGIQQEPCQNVWSGQGGR